MRRFFLTIFILLFSSNMLYADAIFDEIVSVMKNNPTSEQVEGLKYRYITNPNEPHPLVTGSGYITDIAAPTDEGEFEIILSDTDKDDGYPGLINVAIATLYKDIWDTARGFKKGDRIYFTGQLTNIFYGTIYIKGIKEISK